MSVTWILVGRLVRSRCRNTGSADYIDQRWKSITVCQSEPFLFARMKFLEPTELSANHARRVVYLQRTVLNRCCIQWVTQRKKQRSNSKSIASWSVLAHQNFLLASKLSSLVDKESQRALRLTLSQNSIDLPFLFIEYSLIAIALQPEGACCLAKKFSSYPTIARKFST